MYYSIFEGMPYEGKEKLGGQLYTSLLSHLHESPGFHEDSFMASPHSHRWAVNVAVWDDAEAVKSWRNEEHHLSAQKKGNLLVYEDYRLRLCSELDPKSTDEEKAKSYVSLVYRVAGTQTPVDDVLKALKGNTSQKKLDSLETNLLDSCYYQGEKGLWITAWRTREAVDRLEEILDLETVEKIIKLQVDRDYTKTSREDAPHETPGGH